MGFKVNKSEKDIEELFKLIKELNSKVNNKADKETLDSEIAALRKLIEKIQK